VANASVADAAHKPFVFCCIFFPKGLINEIGENLFQKGLVRKLTHILMLYSPKD
jgi:hypothetical protein